MTHWLQDVAASAKSLFIDNLLKLVTIFIFHFYLLFYFL